MNKKNTKRISFFLIMTLVMLSTSITAQERQGAELIIQKKNGQLIKGELISVEQQSLLLLISEGGNISVTIEEIDHIIFKKRAKVFKGMGIGFLTGANFGSVFVSPIFFDSYDDLQWSGTILIGAGFVGVLGALAGGIWELISEMDKKIDVKGKSDSMKNEIIQRLRSHSRKAYHLEHNKRLFPGLSVRFTNVIGSMPGTDFNSAIGDVETSFRREGYEGRIERLNTWRFDSKGELIIHLTERIGFGLGAGRTLRYGSPSGDLFIHRPDYNFNLIFYPKIRSIPITLSTYYFLPGTGRIKGYIHGGIGYYQNRATNFLSVDRTYYASSSGGTWEDYEIEVHDNGIGFHGGIGLDCKITARFGFFCEISGRYCEFKNWKGTGNYSYFSDGGRSKDVSEDFSGTLWFYEDYRPDSGIQYSSFVLSEDRPPGNARKFSIDLSGVSILFGVRIRL